MEITGLYPVRLAVRSLHTLAVIQELPLPLGSSPTNVHCRDAAARDVYVFGRRWPRADDVIFQIRAGEVREIYAGSAQAAVFRRGFVYLGEGGGRAAPLVLPRAGTGLPGRVTMSRPAAYTRWMNSMSFSAVARNNLDAVYRYLLATTKDAALAEDLTSETFERALRRWHRFDPRRAGEKTWLLMLARSAALDHFRAEARRHRREERFAGEQNSEAPDVEIDLGLSPALEEALASLSAAEREVIALRVVVELDGDTAAKVLGISRTACSTRLSRALRKLEERVSAHVAV